MIESYLLCIIYYYQDGQAREISEYFARTAPNSLISAQKGLGSFYPFSPEEKTSFSARNRRLSGHATIADYLGTLQATQPTKE